MKNIIVRSVEQGNNFISLYFDTAKERNEYATVLYHSFENNFPYISLQRRKFAHQPGDVPQFHVEGNPRELGKKSWHHFHIIYPTELIESDWDFLYLWGNRGELVLDRKIKIEKVRGIYNDIIGS